MRKAFLTYIQMLPSDEVYKKARTEAFSQSNLLYGF